MALRRWHVSRVEPRGDYKVFSVSALHTRCEEQSQEHTFFRIESAPWVNIVALTQAEEFVMIRQYRHGAAKTTLEIPGGLVDAGETPEVAAVRELLEETGYAAGRVQKIGAVNPNPALFANRVHTFLATGCRLQGEIQNTATEQTEVELLTPAQLRACINANEVDHALVIAALYWYEQHARG